MAQHYEVLFAEVPSRKAQTMVTPNVVPPGPGHEPRWPSPVRTLELPVRARRAVVVVMAASLVVAVLGALLYGWHWVFMMFFAVAVVSAVLLVRGISFYQDRGPPVLW